MKSVGPRQNPVPSSTTSKPAEPAELPRGTGTSGPQGWKNGHGVGRPPKSGDSHGDNAQMGCDKKRPKKDDDFETAPKPLPRLNPAVLERLRGNKGPVAPTGRGYVPMRGPGVSASGKGSSDNVMLGNDRPGHGGGLFPEPGKPGVSVGSLATLLQRLLHVKPQPAAGLAAGLVGGSQGPSTGGVPPGKWLPIRPGGSSADNISKYEPMEGASLEASATSVASLLKPTSFAQLHALPRPSAVPVHALAAQLARLHRADE